MGHVRVRVEIARRAGERFESIEALVDTGATYTWVPRGILEALGVPTEEERLFVLADGREVRCPGAWITIKIGERVQPTIVVFGEPGSEPILGVVTLEEFLLAADPVSRRLIPVPGLLKAGGLTPLMPSQYSVLTPLIPSPFGRGETKPVLRAPSPEGRGGQGVRTDARHA